MSRMTGFAGTVAVLLVLLSSCRYSFTGGSVPPHLKTIAIPIVQDQSGFGDPQLKDQCTQQLVQKFTGDGTLTLTDRGSSDSVLETVITRVAETPVVVTAGEQVTQRRMTVTVHATFTDLKLRKVVWEKDFSQWGDYSSGGGPTQRAVGITEAIRKITEDLLNETVAGW